MIVKMKFLSIAGPKADIDRVTETYLSKYEIYLENALSELKTVKSLKPYIEINPYKELLAKSKEFLSLIDTKNVTFPDNLSIEESISIINSTDELLRQMRTEKAKLEKQRDELQASLIKIQPFRELRYDIEKILDFNFIRFRFGKIANEYYQKFERYVYDDLNTIFYKCHSDENYVWGVYFMPVGEKDKVDAVYASLHFERFFLPDEYTGTPEEAYTRLEEQIMELSADITAINMRAANTLASIKEKLLAAHKKLETFAKNFDIRKMAACTRDYHDVFYILCGWMSEKDALLLQKDVAHDDNLFVIMEDDVNNIPEKPPTKLKNPKLFRPFESFIRMYGLPAYNEFDPTIFLALSYILIFGCMFGDVGQGLLLAAGGALLYKFRKMDIGAIVSMAGLSSILFGFLYGSFFGFEDVLPALWMKPMEMLITLPVLGSLNSILVITVAFGMAMILISMIINIVNGIRQHNIEKVLFDQNGISGLIFYGSAVAIIVLFMTGHALPGGILLGVLFLIPLLLITFKEPLALLVEKKTEHLPKDKAMFLTQAIFELIEIVLSYMTNTISFVRIGAFALSHAGMMEAVMMLAGAENGGSPNWIVIILGNLFVMGMEGLIVGIHALRLEYYEIFSRFFSGNGREFKPYSNQ
ncbi:V-type ATP synthase subunit I [Anaerobium acetethylicum]|uniref:V/A-type H+-transporting ATPase subunit I n=1 Tax=Anaerobium acetethylicum TaxID=1619234 RepID=A0A1D3TRN3_9FIRM|nr:V/A-type H+-transporting ATPase subunit I [Anaerobium acetethylicum]